MGNGRSIRPLGASCPSRDPALSSLGSQLTSVPPHLLALRGQHILLSAQVQGGEGEQT